MAVNWIIRPFDASDLPALHDVRHAAYRPVFASFRRLLGDAIAAVALVRAEEEQGALLDAICTAGSAHEVLVASVEGAVVGFVSLRLHQAGLGEIDLNAVHPSHAGHGIGTALYEAALARLKALGATTAMVGTGGDESHAPARRAYEKAGFTAALPSVWLYRLL